MDRFLFAKAQVWRSFVLGIVVLGYQSLSAQLITWHNDKAGLPYAVYNGKIPFDNKQLDQPKDPFFMMGNYKFLVLPHVSGVYQLLCGERAWGRLNDAGPVINYGSNNATIKINGETFPLTGMYSQAASNTTKHTFGVGFARFDYELSDNIRCTRNISVKPSPSVNKGVPGMLITVEISNNSNTSQKIAYNESVTARYRMIAEKTNQHISYPCTASKIAGTNTVKALFDYESADPLLITGKDDVSAYDGYPAALFMAPLSSAAAGGSSGFQKINGYASSLFAAYSFTLKPHEKRTINFVVGYAISRKDADVLAVINELGKDVKLLPPTQSSLYATAWAAKLPGFLKEPDTAMRRELVWNAYVLDAFAKHSAYYDETFIPQGMVYDFVWGKQAAARDLIQAALPLCYYNPALAKSTLKLMMKKMFSTGLLEYTDFGYGAQTSFMHKTSDQQLFFFLLMSEYLKQSKDFSFLKEKTPYYPKAGNNMVSTLDKITQAFLYIRDEIGTGSHGMIKIMNSDWNDVVFNYYPINIYYVSAESHMNASLALNAMYGLIENLEAAMKQPNLAAEKLTIAKLVASMKMYRQKQLAVFIKDMDKRTFPRRLYLNREIAIGDTDMYLEPVVYMMGIPDLPLAIKQSTLIEMNARLMLNEPLGAREMEVPKPSTLHGPGVRENGGFWYSLNGALMIGLSTWNRPASMDLYKKMSFSNYSNHYPDGWVGWWSAPDAVNSNISTKPGDVSPMPAPYPVFCSHAHMWTVLGYYYLYK